MRLTGIAWLLTFAIPVWATPPCHAVAALVSQPNQGSPTGDAFGELPHERHFVLHPSERPAGGSQGGLWLTDGEGNFFFGKEYDGNEPRLIAEHLTDEIYREMGVKVPDTFLRRLNGKPYLLSAEVKGNLPGDPRSLLRSDVGEHFVIDAWLANWDVLGDAYDNVVVKGGEAVRVDNGGALFWRAQGEKKPFGPEVKELESMRNPDVPAAAVFGHLSDAQIAGQIRQFIAGYAKRRGAILSLVRQSGLPPADRARIVKALDDRAKWMVDVALPKYQRAAREKQDPGQAASDELRAILGTSLWSSTVEEKRKHLPRAAAKLTDGELVALDEYAGGDFMEINAALRGTGEGFEDWLTPADQRRFHREAYQPYAELAEQALKKLPDFRGTVTRVVELGPSQIARYRVGRTVTETAFTSTTYKGTTPYPGNVQFEIASRHGKHIDFINPNEDEVLFPPGVTFKIVGKRYDREEETWHIRLAEVTP